MWILNVIPDGNSLGEELFEVRDSEGRLVCDNEPYYPHRISYSDAEKIVEAVNFIQGGDRD